MVTPNVIPLKPSSGGGNCLNSQFLAALRNCHNQVQQQLEPLLQRMFESADDTLFAYSNKAENPSQQSAYFDAMRDLRLRRREMIDRFNQQMGLAYRRFEKGDLGSSDGPGAGGESGLELDSLRLVDESELEESLAVKGMAEKTRSAFGQELFGLEQRLGHCFEVQELKDEANPFGPEAIVESFRKGVEVLETKLEVKLIVYKLFERAVLAQLGAVYRDANTLLMEAGILPRLKSQVSAPSGQRAGAGQRAGGSAGGEAAAAAGGAAAPAEGGGGGVLAGEEAGFLGAVHELLAQARSTVGWEPLPVSPNGTGDPGELLRALSGVQFGGGAAGALDQPLPQGMELRQLLGNMLGSENIGLGHREADVIDLVSMMFEFILDDEDVPDSLKALIGRLQIPYIKVALVDREFFARKSHPARRLLNELARAGLGLEPEARAETSPLLGRIKDVVHRIVAEFADDVELFQELLGQFTDYLNQEAETERAAADEQLKAHRLREERERTRQEVQRLVDKALSELTAPETVAEVLKGPWVEVLTETRIQDGEGALWRDRVGFIDDLVWSVRPRRSAGERQVLARNLPKLLRRLAQGLDLLGYSMEDRKAILKVLEPFHLASLRGESPAPAPASVPAKEKRTPVKSPTPTPAVPAASAATPTPQAKVSVEPPKTEPVPPTLTDDTKKGGMFDEAISAMEGQLADLQRLEDMLSEEPDIPHEEFVPLEEELEPEVEVEPEFLDMARALTVGTWVEFSGMEGSKRAKLAWKSDLLGDFTFVNWKFQVVAERSTASLGVEFRDGLVRVIEDVPVLDRALDAVLNRLRGHGASA